MKSRWRSHDGVEFMHLDYSGFRADFEALRAEVQAADAVIVTQRPNSVRVLIDLRDTVASGKVVEMFKGSAPITAPYIRRHALVGLTGFKRFLADKVARVMGRPMRAFDTEEAALDWLASGADVVAPARGELLGA